MRLRRYELSKFFLGLFSLCYKNLELRSNFIESTLSDLHYAHDLGVPRRNILIGATLQALHHALRNTNFGILAFVFFLVINFVTTSLVAGNSNSLFFWGTMLWLSFNSGLFFYFFSSLEFNFAWLYLVSHFALASTMFFQDKEFVSSCEDCGSIAVNGVIYFGKSVHSQPQLAFFVLFLAVLTLSIFMYSITNFFIERNVKRGVAFSIILIFHSYFTVGNLATLGYWRSVGLSDFIQPLIVLVPIEQLKVVVYVSALVVLILATIRRFGNEATLKERAGP